MVILYSSGQCVSDHLLKLASEVGESRSCFFCSACFYTSYAASIAPGESDVKIQESSPGAHELVGDTLTLRNLCTGCAGTLWFQVHGTQRRVWPDLCEE